MFKSVDQGARWTHVAASLQADGLGLQRIHQIVPHPTNASIVYAVVDIWGIAKSVDGGITWRRVGNGLPNEPYFAMAMDPVAPDTLYTAARWGSALYRTTNGGNGWSAVDGTLRLSACVMQMVPGTLYVGSCDAGLIVVTQDGAEVRADATQLGEYVQALAVNPLHPDHLVWTTQPLGTWASDDGALTRHAASSSLFSALAYVPGSSEIAGVDFAAPAHLVRGMDSSPAWTSSTLTGVRMATSVVPRRDGAILVGSLSGVHRVDGDGAQALNAGLEPSRVTTALVDDTDPQRILVGVEDVGLYRTIDGGASWTNIWPNSFTLRGLCSDAEDRDALFVTSGYSAWRSLEGGDTWEELMGLPDSAQFTIAAQPLVAGRVYVTTFAGVHVSDDKGETWTHLPDLPDGVLIQRLAFDPVDPARLYGIAVEGLFSTADGGQHWDLLVDTHGRPWSYSLVVTPQNPQQLMLSTIAAIYRSEDRGRNWTAISASLPYAGADLAVSTDGVRILASFSEGGGVYVSENAGVTWQALTRGLGNHHVKALARSAADPLHPVVATSGGVFRLVEN